MIDINYLKYGSLITLSTKEGYFLYSDGFLQTSPYLQESSSQHFDLTGAIFQVIPQCLYSAQKNLHEYIKGICEVDFNEKLYNLMKIEENLEGEIKANINAYNLSKGQEVLYNSLIQLEHIKSHKFLTLQSEKSAETEKDNFKLSFEDFPSEHSHFRIVPSFKYQNHGNRKVKFSDKIYLQILVPELRKIAWMHESKSADSEIYDIDSSSYDSFVKASKTFEVNISLDQKTRLVLGMYSEHLHSDKILFCGCHIWLHLPEDEVLLTLQKESWEDDNEQLVYSKTLQDTNGLWMIESEDFFHGGAVNSDKFYRLKHIATKKYLGIKKEAYLTFKRNKKTLWKFIPVHSKDYVKGDGICFLVNKNKNLTIKYNEGNLEVDSNLDEHCIYKPSIADSKVIWETQFLLYCFPILASFPSQLEKLIHFNENKIKYFKFHKYCDSVISTIKSLQLFMENKLGSLVGVDTHFGEVQKSRQAMLKQQNFFEVLTNIIKCNAIEENYELIKEVCLKRRKYRLTKSESDLDDVKTKTLISILKEIYSLLLSICNNNNENQKKAYEYRRDYAKHIGLKLGATKLLLQILGNNEDLMLGISNDSGNLVKSACKKFEEFLDYKKKDLIKFLGGICVFKGEAISVNQEYVFASIIKKKRFSKILIQTETDENNLVLLHSSIKIPLLTCFEEGRIVGYEEEIKYFKCLLKLYSNLCKGRNFESFAYFSSKFPYEVLSSLVWNKDLTISIRGAFCMLLNNLYIDCFFRDEVAQPGKIKLINYNERNELLEMISMSKNLFISDESLYFQAFDRSEMGMHELLTNIADYFEGSGIKKIENIFTFKVLQVILKILQFGVCQVIIDRESVNEKNLNFLRIVESVVPLLSSDLKNSLTRVSTDIQRRSSFKTTMKFSNGDKTVQTNYNSSILKDASNFNNPVIRSAMNLKNFLILYKRNPFNNLEKKFISHKIKLKICKILEHLLDTNQNYLLDNIIEWFRKTENKIYSAWGFKKLLPDILVINNNEVFDQFRKKNFLVFKKPSFPKIHNLSPGIIQRFILAFTESENYKLQTKLLSLLLRSYSQRIELLKNIKDIHVLSRFQDISLYNWLKSTLRTFKHNSEQSEIWMNYWNYSPSLAAKNKEVFASMMEILNNLTFFFHDDVYIVDDKLSQPNSQTISKSRQEILYFLKVHNIIVNLIKDGIYKLVAIYNENRQVELQEPCELLTKLFQSCYKVLKRFVYDNFRNQKKLYEYIHVLMQYLHIPLGQISLICEIFKNNAELVNKITEEFIDVFRELINKYGRQSDFLRLFEVIQVVNEKPDPRIQRLIISVFIKEKINNYILYMTDEEVPKFDFYTLAPKNLFYNDEPFKYHSMLLLVLAKCGYGTSGMLLNEAKCQNIVSLDNIFDILIQCEDDQSPFFKLKIPASLFLYHIYLECERINIELKLNPRFLSYIKLQTENIESFDEFSMEFIEFFEVFVKIIVKYRESYIKKIHKKYFEQEDVIVLRSFCVTIVAKSKKICFLLKHSTVNSLYDLCLFFGENLETQEQFINNASEESEKVNFYNLHRTTSIMFQQTIKGLEIEKWLEVREAILYNKEIKDCLKDEEQALIYTLYYINKVESNCSFEKVIKSLILYLRLSQSQMPPTKLLIMVIKLVEKIISTPIVHETKDAQSAMTDMQCKMSYFGLTNVILTLFMDEQLPIKIFHSLISLSNALLEGGNYRIQQEFYQYFLNYPRSEFFFNRLRTVIREKIEKILEKNYSRHSPNPIFKEHKSRIKKILRFLQLLCENHNSYLQNYLRVQEKSHNNYNMVAEVLDLLETLMKKKIFIHFPIISQCFETLTEFIQGPCFKNQEHIINSNFIEITEGLLSLNEYEDSHRIFKGLELKTFVTEESKDYGDYYENCYLTGWMLAHLKLKCLITLISLFEGRKDQLVSTRIVRSLNLQILIENIKYLYINHKNSHRSFSSSYKEFAYNYDIFNHIRDNENYDFDSDSNPQDKRPDYYCLVIENGFLIYNIIKTLQDSNDPEIIEMFNEEISELLGDLSSFKLRASARKKNSFFRKKEIKLSISRYIYCGPSYETNNKALIADAFGFFNKHTGNIEVVFAGGIFRVYFYYPPEFKGLSKAIKENFHRKAVRESDQAKLKYLLDSVPEIMEIIKHEFFLMNLIKKNKIAHFIASNIENFRISAFILTILLNLTILTSYKFDRVERSAFTYAPDDDGIGVNATKIWMNFLGFLQLALCILIVIFFLAKAGPILAKKGWEQTNFFTLRLISSKYTIAHIIVKIFRTLNTIFYVLSDIDVIFYTLYTVFSVLGTSSHPIYFSLLLLDIVYRYPSLQNVVNSIYLPRKALLLTFALMIVIVYLFAIFSYFLLEEYFNPNCRGLLQCLLVVWDQSFKNSGGIGGYLDYPSTPSYDPTRFVFDNIYNILVMIVLLGVVQGIITDTFARLREEQEFCKKDMENKCFICGLQRDYIEKNTVQGFLHHIENDHNEWNYILFIVYLLDKKETEYSGIESYIREQYDKDDLVWIPNKVSLSIAQPKNAFIDSNVKVFEEKIQELESEIKLVKRK